MSLRIALPIVALVLAILAYVLIGDSTDNAPVGENFPGPEPSSETRVSDPAQTPGGSAVDSPFSQTAVTQPADNSLAEFEPAREGVIVPSRTQQQSDANNSANTSDSTRLAPRASAGGFGASVPAASGNGDPGLPPEAGDIGMVGPAPEASEAGDSSDIGLPPEVGELALEYGAPEAGVQQLEGSAPEASDPGVIGPAPEDSN